MGIQKGRVSPTPHFILILLVLTAGSTIRNEDQYQVSVGLPQALKSSKTSSERLL